MVFGESVWDTDTFGFLAAEFIIKQSGLITITIATTAASTAIATIVVVVVVVVVAMLLEQHN